MFFVYRTYDFLSRYRKALLAALIVFIIAFGVSVLLRGAIGEPYRTDMTVFIRAAQAVDAGTDIYDAKTERQWNYVYLPLLAILLRPCAHLPLWFSVLAGYVLSAAMLAGTVYAAKCLDLGKITAWRPAVLALVFSLPVMLNTMARGQLGILSLFFAVVCFVLYQKKRHFLAGFLLGFAIVLKISPVFFLLGFFFLQKAWRVLAGAALAALIFILIVPAAAVGWDRNLTYLQTWFEAMRLATSKFAQQSQLWGQLLDPYAEDNQSFYSVMMRLWGPARDQLVPGADTMVRFAARGLALLLLALLAGAMLLRQRKNIQKGLFLEYALFSMVMLYASPVSESHHYTTVYLLFLTALSLLAGPSLGLAARRWVEAALWIAVGSLLLGMIFDSLNYAGAFVWGTFFLWAVLWIVHLSKILTADRRSANDPAVGAFYER